MTTQDRDKIKFFIRILLENPFYFLLDTEERFYLIHELLERTEGRPEIFLG